MGEASGLWEGRGKYRPKRHWRDFRKDESLKMWLQAVTITPGHWLKYQLKAFYHQLQRCIVEAHVTIHQKSLRQRKEGTSKKVWHRLCLIALGKSSQKYGYIWDKIPTKKFRPTFWGPDMAGKVEHGYLCTAGFITFLNVSEMEMSTMMKFTWEGEAEVMCKTAVQSAPLLQATGRASASLTSLLLSSLLATSGLEILHHSWLFQRDFSRTNLLSSLPLQTEIASPSIPNFALTHVFPPPLNSCLISIWTGVHPLIYHQLDTNSLLTFHLLSICSILSTWS